MNPLVTDPLSTIPPTTGQRVLLDLEGIGAAVGRFDLELVAIHEGVARARQDGFLVEKPQVGQLSAVDLRTGALVPITHVSPHGVGGTRAIADELKVAPVRSAIHRNGTAANREARLLSLRGIRRKGQGKIRSRQEGRAANLQLTGTDGVEVRLADGGMAPDPYRHIRADQGQFDFPSLGVRVAVVDRHRIFRNGRRDPRELRDVLCHIRDRPGADRREIVRGRDGLGRGQGEQLAELRAVVRRVGDAAVRVDAHGIVESARDLVGDGRVVDRVDSHDVFALCYRPDDSSRVDADLPGAKDEPGGDHQREPICNQYG